MEAAHATCGMADRNATQAADVEEKRTRKCDRSKGDDIMFNAYICNMHVYIYIYIYYSQIFSQLLVIVFTPDIISVFQGASVQG